MKKRQRLKRGETSRKKDRLQKVQQFEQTIGQPPTFVKSSETSSVISVGTAYHKPFSDKGFENMVEILREKGKTVEAKSDYSAVLNVDSNSPLVSYFKKHGIKAGSKYVINDVGYIEKADTGYDVEFVAGEGKREVYGLAYTLLAYMNVPVRLQAKSKEVASGAIKETVAGKEISIDFDKRELTKENVNEMCVKMQEAGDKVSQAVGENWFPVGFAHIEVDKKSPLVDFFKKYGTHLHGEEDWVIEGFGRLSFYGRDKTAWLSLKCIPERSATESQSLNYQEPMHDIAMKMLERMGVKGYVKTMVD